MKLENIKAILFDIDGTLINTTNLILSCYSHTFKTHHIAPKKSEEIIKLFGKPLEECYKILCPEENNKMLCETHLSFQEKNLHLCKIFPGVKNTLSTLKKNGLKIAVVSARSKRTTRKSLETTGILKYIDVVISREDVVHSKPNPESLLLALKTLKVDPRYAIMVGDTSVDIEAGRNAGTKTIGVTYGPLGNMLKKTDPDVLISLISEIMKFV
jgi:pyrophosphatase PpaX